jgi:hypothetical protein
MGTGRADKAQRGAAKAEAFRGVYFGLLMRKNGAAAFTNRRALWHTDCKAIF